MADLFEQKNIAPMLLTLGKPFDSDDYLYEMKYDGVRGIAYLDKDKTVLRNKRNKIIDETYPELKNIHTQVSDRCILDGEIVVLTCGKPDFFAMQKRSLMTDPIKIGLMTEKTPVTFVAFDILYYKNTSLLDTPLYKRKELLREVVTNDTNRLFVTSYIQSYGEQLYEMAVQNGLEGVVAKHKESLYYLGKRTRSWVKFKAWNDEDFVVCGYTQGEHKPINSLILGLFRKDGSLIYQGSVGYGVSGEQERIILNLPKSKPHFEIDKQVNWVVPLISASVKFLGRTQSGLLRQPALRGVRLDKSPINCILGDDDCDIENN